MSSGNTDLEEWNMFQIYSCDGGDGGKGDGSKDNATGTIPAGISAIPRYQ
jgi:hypothetical protein